MRWLAKIVIVLLSCCSGMSLELVSRIAFGSCANQSAPQPIWDAIIGFDPQVFIWMGDNIYGDIRRPFKLFGKERTIGPWKNVPRFYPSSEHEMKSRYQKAKTIPGYSTLTRRTKVIGTWDDHDYGLNDAGKEFKSKITNQRLLLDFLDEPLESTRRKQAGVYASYIFGPVGKHVKVILLDTRYYRDPLSSDGSILGDAQWTWLERELKGPPTAITIIVSSIQVISNHSATTGPLFYTESWGRFPREKSRLFKLISDSKREGVFFISGDVHFGEIAKYNCAASYPLYDITSSGLTQAVEKAVSPPLHFIVRFLAWLTPAIMRVKDKNCKYRSCTYGQPNFGTIEINWDSDPVVLTFDIRDEKGLPVIALKLPLSELQGQKVDSQMTVGLGKFQMYCSLEVDLPWFVRYRLAIFFFSALAGRSRLVKGIGATCEALVNIDIPFHVEFPCSDCGGSNFSSVGSCNHRTPLCGQVMLQEMPLQIQA
ncbi:hypothetical protein RND71_027256 [Anisodus tanguticus]|uniref:PhoD-like phosphatase metallophosphatase domain-containing protein n=1 Tax=Anisodus tanguticus TaxID=243964 RepID=A0AAE1RIQ2_9SOLA|nr:hypothetical protein RND71_027256 [Anisodus tanguticus]